MTLRARGWPRGATPTMCTALLVVSFLLASCRATNDPAVVGNTSSETVVSSTPPFQTKEPERYRATRTITIVNAAGETLVTKSSIARDGDVRRNESEMASKKLAYLDVPQGRFVLLPADKIYADLTQGESDLPAIEDDEGLELSPERLLHSDAGSTSYQKLGTETIGGRDSNKFRIVVNSSSTANVSQNETLIWIDESLRMPIKSETKSADGTRVTMELSDIKLDVERHMFEIPTGYEKVTFTELRKRLGVATSPSN